MKEVDENTPGRLDIRPGVFLSEQVECAFGQGVPSLPG